MLGLKYFGNFGVGAGVAGCLWTIRGFEVLEKGRSGAALIQDSLSETGAALRLTAIGHEADAGEAKDQHCPG